VGLFFLVFIFLEIASLIFLVSVTYDGQLTVHHTAAPIAVITPKSSPVTPNNFATTPAWSQNFTIMPNGPLSTSVWQFNIGNGGPSNPGWGNGEQEYYTNSTNNARIEDGNLIIEALNQSMGGVDYTSARITTTPSLNFTYGELDVIAKIPSGIGTWPAIWLLPSNGKYALTTAAGEQDPNNWLRDGEIDIMEATGSLPGQISSSAQSYTYNPGNNNERVAVLNIDNDAAAFHDYELQWTPSSLIFLVDGTPYHTVTKSPTDTYLAWPYDQPFYLLLNIAMGGTEGGTDVQQFPPYGIDNSSGPWEMTVKSINYYPYTGSNN
jgi:beta-glucanase (GH16 family)